MGLTATQSRRLSEAMKREVFVSSAQMRDNIYQIRQMLGLPYIFIGGWDPESLISEWRHLTRLVADWNVSVR